MEFAWAPTSLILDVHQMLSRNNINNSLSTIVILKDPRGLCKLLCQCFSPNLISEVIENKLILKSKYYVKEI